MQLQPADVRPLLAQERSWTAYALGDLQSPWWERCAWQVHANGVILRYFGLEPPVLMALGNAKCLQCAELPDECYQLSVRSEHLPVLRAKGYRLNLLAMQRWCWRGETVRFQQALAGASQSGVERLGAADIPALQQLLAPALGTSEEADGFQPDQVENGIFYGVWRNGRLAALAGTHLVSQAEGVAAVGNIYTAPAWRAQKLAQFCTAQVVQDLLQLKIDTIVLNVKQRNHIAQRVYTHLGFVAYCDFFEGFAEKELY